MLFSTTDTSPTYATVQLAPSYRLPLALLTIALGLTWLNLWLGLAIALFSVFLLIQAATLRLVFTATALDIWRGDRQIRSFPYQDWQHWEIFWSPVPILFYFREVKSIHFVPVLFDPSALRACLTERCPQLSASADS